MTRRRLDDGQVEMVTCSRCGEVYEFTRRRGRLRVPRRIRCRGCRTWLAGVNWRALHPRRTPKPVREPVEGLVP